MTREVNWADETGEVHALTLYGLRMTGLGYAVFTRAETVCGINAGLSITVTDEEVTCAPCTDALQPSDLTEWERVAKEAWQREPVVAA
jgi:hypothetical protein